MSSKLPRELSKKGTKLIKFRAETIKRGRQNSFLSQGQTVYICGFLK